MQNDIETLNQVAERVFDANHKRDYALARHLLGPYRFGTWQRNHIDARMRQLSADHRTANLPTYFR